MCVRYCPDTPRLRSGFREEGDVGDWDPVVQAAEEDREVHSDDEELPVVALHHLDDLADPDAVLVDDWPASVVRLAPLPHEVVLDLAQLQQRHVFTLFHPLCILPGSWESRSCDLSLRNVLVYWRAALLLVLLWRHGVEGGEPALVVHLDYAGEVGGRYVRVVYDEHPHPERPAQDALQ